MESATRQIAGGLNTVPDGHAEFFLASLAGVLPVYQSLAPPETWHRWHDRMRLPIAAIYGPTHNHNWRT